MGRSCEGLVALVTGASQGGTGRAVAVRLAAEGARVGITARSVDGLNQTLAMIEEVGGQGLVMPCDLTDPDGGRVELVARTEEHFGQPLDLLVNNAVVHDQKPIVEWTIPELRTYQEANVWSPWEMMIQVMPGMVERGSGSILNLTSFSGELPPGPPFAYKAKDGSNMYGSMKAALNRLTVAAAGELEGTGVSCNALTPQSAILTPQVIESGYVATADLFEPPETMAEAALALLTEDRSVITGRIAFSLQLLLELERPCYDLAGTELVEGWQPADLVAAIHAREDFNTSTGWPDSYDFHRPNTPYPDALRR
jgi:NAD(P)-dependent dehydrogenase (short-subunit alcohol dehydrogenase family)